MKHDYLKLPDARKLLTGQQERTLLTWCCRFFLLAFIVGYSTFSSFSQIITEGAAVKANFGIDADIYTDFLLDPSLDTVNPIGTDDWFEMSLGSGSPVFKPSQAFIDAINAALAVDENFSFQVRMSDFGHIERNYGPDANGIIWIDGVYARDNNTAGNGKDSTAFGGTSDKNFQDPSTWDVGIKDPYQKGDLVDVYAHMRQEANTDVWGIGAFSTRSTSGSVHADFEFFRNEFGFDGAHFSNTGSDHGHTSWTFDPNNGQVDEAGDLIVSIDYEKGGDDPVASIRVWVSEADYIWGLANFGVASSFKFTGDFTAESGVGFGYAEIEPAIAGGNPSAWAVVNVDSVSPAPPWGTLEGPQAGINEEYLPLQFAEFAINLSFLGLDAFGGDACNKRLGSLLVKTRSSPSFESEMHDFVGPLPFGYDLETKIVATDLDSCDDGINQFDLMTAVDSFGDGNVTFYAIHDDAFAVPPVNAISSIQILPVGDTMFWARSSNPDDGACFAVDSFMVTVHDNPSCTVTATDQANYSTTNGTAKVTVTGGEAPYTYVWSTDNGSIGGGQGTDSIYGLSIGRYYVDIVDANGCTTSCNDSVGWAPAAPTCQLFTVDVECFGAETGYAWAVVAPTGPDSFPPYTYYWYEGTGFDRTFLDSTVTISMVDTMFNLGVGLYSVEVKNSVDPNTSFCADSIKQPPYNPVTVECAGLTLGSCLEQSAVDLAFANWLDTAFMVTGGTDPLDTLYKVGDVIADLDTVETPLACGGSVTIKMIVTDNCSLMDSCEATFSVTDAPSVWLTPPANDTLEACSSEAEIAAEFDSWLDSVKYGGGCNTMIGDGDPSAPDSCGGEVMVYWSVSSECEADLVDSAVFVVKTAPSVWLIPPANDTLEACSSEAEIAAEFDSWLDSVKYGGGCNTMIGDGNPSAPDKCGGQVTVYWTVSSDCEADLMDSAVFVVRPDTVMPMIVIRDHPDSICSVERDGGIDPASYYLTADWTDNCKGSGTMDSLPTVVPVDPNDPMKCDEYWIYSFTYTDDCGNSATVRDTIIKFTESEGDCETAFARLPEPDLPDPELIPWTTEIGARCFLYEPDTAIFNRWGWTNRIKVGQDSVYTMDVYAGAGQCELSKGTWVGTVTLSFSGSTMNVVYDLDDAYVISEAHIYAGSSMYPTWKNGKHKGEYTVAPGQYTVVWENEPPATGLDVDLTDVSDGDYIFVIVHSVVCIPTCNCPETIRTDVSLASTAIVKTRTNGKKSAEITGVGVVAEGQLKVYPNPFSSKVTFEFVSPVDAYGTLELYNITGQRVARLLDRFVIGEELNKVEFRPANEVSGIYLYRLDLDGEIQIGRIIYKKE
ncbi:MAG: T9SS type A sorting domain-containing protein [Draconibacterium sp.]